MRLVRRRRCRQPAVSFRSVRTGSPQLLPGGGLHSRTARKQARPLGCGTALRLKSTLKRSAGRTSGRRVAPLCRKPTARLRACLATEIDLARGRRAAASPGEGPLLASARAAASQAAARVRRREELAGKLDPARIGGLQPGYVAINATSQTSVARSRPRAEGCIFA